MLTSNGKFHGTIAPTTPTGSRQTFRVVMLAGEGHERVAEIGLPRVLVDQLGGIGERIGQRRVELRTVRQHARTAGLEDQLFAQLLPLGLERRLELLEAALAERAVGRPVGLVEGASRGVDGAMHVRLRRVARPRRGPPRSPG